MIYEIPKVNPGQNYDSEPKELAALTMSPKSALEWIQEEVRKHPGSKVLAADDKKWLRCGFRIERPDGSLNYVCCTAKEAMKFSVAFKYESLRAMLAWRLQNGEPFDKALYITVNGFNKAEDIYGYGDQAIQAVMAVMATQRKEKADKK